MKYQETATVLKRAEIEKAYEYRKWTDEIPNLSFPPDWQIRIIPPFGGAVVRFLVFKDGRRVSVYLDCYEELGAYDGPYWEVYPHEGDVARCPMADIETLMRYITESLSEKSTS